MKRFNLLLATGLAILPIGAFAQTTMGTDSKPVAPQTSVTQPVVGQTSAVAAQPSTTAPKAADATKPADMTPAAKTATTQPAGIKSDATPTRHAHVKTMHVNHAHAVAPTGIQVKQPEPSKS